MEWISRRRIIGAVVLSAVMIAFGQAGAQDDDAEPIEAPLERPPTLEIADFVGEWQGMGILETEDSLFFSMNRRDIDVRIEGNNSRFTVEWTAVTRSGNNPDDPEIRRESASLTFTPSDHPHVYEASTSADPLGGGVLSWARLHGETLSVYQMAILEDGGYSVATYDRTLVNNELQLRFVRLQDGQPVRQVNGQLSRVAP